MSVLYSVVGFLIAIAILVAVHEFGHFWVARRLGVKVLRFSIGFGKPLWSKVYGPDQTEYVLAAIPLGGYVKMLGESDHDTPIDPKEAHRAFDAQPIWKRSLIVAAGPGINFLFAILLFFMLALPNEEALKPILGQMNTESALGKAGISDGARLISVDGRSFDYHGQYFLGQHDLYIFNQVLRAKPLIFVVEPAGVDSTSSSLVPSVLEIEVKTDDIPIYNINPGSLLRELGVVPPMPDISTQLSMVVPNSAAEKAGLKVGDIVIAVDTVSVESWWELVEIIKSSPSRTMLLTIDRGDSRLRLNVTPDAFDTGSGVIGRIGVSPKILPWRNDQKVTVDSGLMNAVMRGVEQTWLMSAVTVRMLWKMVTLQVSHRNISGPITIADVAGQAIQIGLDYYLYILAVISISLGVMNLLPIPMLDGGHLMMYLVEIVGGKTLSQKVFAVGQQFGILLLVGLMSLAFYNDIFRLLN